MYKLEPIYVELANEYGNDISMLETRGRKRRQRSLLYDVRPIYQNPDIIAE